MDVGQRFRKSASLPLPHTCKTGGELRGDDSGYPSPLENDTEIVRQKVVLALQLGNSSR